MEHYRLTSATRLYDARQNLAIALQMLSRFEDARIEYRRCFEFWNPRNATKTLEVLEGWLYLERADNNDSEASQVLTEIARVKALLPS